MSFLDSVDTGGVADSVASSSSWWDTGVKWATNAFEWMEDHPEATNMLGGVAAGVGTYFAQRDKLRREERAAKRQWEREREAQMISPGNVQGYGSHTGKFSGGLLTGGPVAGYRDLQSRR